MHLWIVCISEPLPVDPGSQRPLRAGMLARTLRSLGHTVTWWTSGFNHSAKRHRAGKSQSVVSPEGIQLRLLHGIGYTRNVGMARLVNHLQLAREFRRLAPAEPAPDLIFCCWPSIELGAAAVGYAERRGIPILLDVRDLWPDIFLDAAPRVLRPLVRLALAPYSAVTRSAFARATGIVGISAGYLAWGLAKARRPLGRNDAMFPLGYQEPDRTSASVAEGTKRLRAQGVDPARMVCWFLGSFGDTYDLEPVLAAARELEAAGCASPLFVLSGDGEGRDRYHRLADGLGNVVFTGWLDGDGIAAMMGMARLGLAAYRKGAPQGLPNKLFEYMAAGLPILSSLEGECRDFLAENGCGRSYPAGSTTGLLAALMPLVEDRALAAGMGRQGQSVYRERFAASIVYPALIEHCAEVVARSQKVTCLAPSSRFTKGAVIPYE